MNLGLNGIGSTPGRFTPHCSKTIEVPIYSPEGYVVKTTGFVAFLVCIALLLVSARLSAQSTAKPDAEQARILTLENAWNQAIQQKDARALQMLLSQELVYVDYDGSLMDKAEYLASVQLPSLHPTHIVSEAMTGHLYGAVAVVRGVYREIGVKNGKPYAVRMRFTDTWIRRGESWVCVASHSTLIG
jgi:ketosteroid isomerase-like protein